MPADVEAFKALERAGWAEKAESYDLLTGRITARVVDPLLDAAGVTAGLEVLDVGSGPGHAAQRAAERGATVTGIDAAWDMVSLARRRHPGIRFLCADAESLPFADGRFNAVVGNFSINHIPRPEFALGEFARVMAAGASIALSAWEAPERGGHPGILVEALRASGVTRPEDVPAGPDPYRFADDSRFRELLGGAGLVDVAVEAVAFTQRVRDPEELWLGMLGGSVRTAGLVERQPPDVRETIRARVEQLAEKYREDGGLAVPVRAKIARGVKV
jgi:SAM-dependent methyltransferase